MVIPSKFLTQLELCSLGVVLVLLMDPIDSLDCFPVLSSNADLFVLCLFFTFFFFLIKLLQIFSQFISLFLFVVSMFTFFILIASVDVNKVFIVILGLLLFLLDYVLTILVYFLDGLSPFLIVIGPSLQIFLFLLPVEFELIFGMIDGIVDFLPFV